jgi:H+/Cl- antiporter ClcA
MRAHYADPIQWFNYDHFPLWYLLLFCTLWMVLMNLSLGIALPGGLLIPTLLVGTPCCTATPLVD